MTSKDVAVIAAKLGNQLGTLYFVSCYLDSLLQIPSRELIKVTDHCNENKIPLVVGMDANAHSRAWGEERANHRGELLEDWLMTSNMYIMNVGRTPTHIPDNGNRGTIIDLTLTNEWAKELINDWTVMTEEPSLSDHRLIRYSMDIIEHKNHILTRSLGKADWSNYRAILQKMDTAVIHETENLHSQAAELECNLQMALDQIAPKKLRPTNDRKIWWTDSLATKRKIIRNLHRKRELHPKVAQKLKELRKEYSQAITKAKRQSWRDFCTKAESAKDISKIIQILESPPMRMMSLLYKGQEVLGPQESLNHLIQTHFPDGVLGEMQPSIASAESITNMDYTGACQFITSRKVRAAFHSFGDFKSPGPDELPPIALKWVDDNHLDVITDLYIKSLATGIVPNCWRHMRVVFIPKAGKSDYAIAKSYRPITLSNFLLKGLERLIQWFILEYYVKEPLFRQHAYTKGRSCDTALSTFVDDVEKAIYNGRYLLAVSLDCSGAFDSIKFDSAKSCMERKGIPDNIVKWYMNLLQHRSVDAEVQGFRATVKPARGSPQGGVLSPLVWNLIMDEFLSQFQKGPVKVLGYADDILLYIEGTEPMSMGELLQPALLKVISWGKLNGLTFNPSKTHTILFTRRRIPSKLPDLLLDGTTLKYSDSFKYLGVEIQRGLSWTRHITERANKCKFLLMKAKNIISTKWGLTPKKMEWVYKAIVRPKLTYGALIWAQNLHEQDKVKIQRIQRLALLAIFTPLRSTPTLGMEVVMGWMPLLLHCTEIGLCAFLRTKSTVHQNWDGIGRMTRITGHIRKWEKLEDDILSSNIPRQPKFCSHIWMDQEIHQSTRQYFERPIMMYTDASKERENVGYAWCACDGDFLIEEKTLCTKDMTIHHAELLAIKEALSWIKQHDTPTRKVIIYSDSQSAVHKMNGFVANDSISLESLKLFKEVIRETPVDIRWVKGHSDHTGNEYADYMARKGVKEADNIHTAYPHLPLSHKTIKQMVHRGFMDRWQSFWDSQSGCLMTRLFIPMVREKKLSTLLSHNELKTIVQIITGHGLFKRHLRHWNDIQDIYCSLCGEDTEDPWHLWNLCPVLKEQRQYITREIEMGLLWERGLLKFFRKEELTKLRANNEALLIPS